MCKDPPTVDNAVLNEVKSEVLLSGESTISVYEYDCSENYYIDDKSKTVVSCQSGSASWNHTSLPVCLKGMFCVNHTKYKVFK